MGIHETKTPIHWNYFLSLEADLHRLSRFVEFTEKNFDCYSIEMARVLLAACSEVDVVAKQICKRINAEQEATNIHEYRKILNPAYPKISKFEVLVRRHGLELKPWTNWVQDKTPYWWSDHNDVKHGRHENFQKANLQNLLNAVAGLFVIVLYLYKEEAEEGLLSPPPHLFGVGEEFYGGTHLGGYENSVLYRL